MTNNELRVILSDYSKDLQKNIKEKQQTLRALQAEVGLLEDLLGYVETLHHSLGELG